MTHDEIIKTFNTYVEENAKFEKGNKTAGTRARKALLELGKLVKTRRTEISEEKNKKTKNL